MQLGDKKLVVQRASVGKNPGSVSSLDISVVIIINPCYCLIPSRFIPCQVVKTRQ